MKQMLAQIKAWNPSASNFKAQPTAQNSVTDSRERRRNDMFLLTDSPRTPSEAQMEQMATQFKAASTIQQEMAGYELLWSNDTFVVGGGFHQRYLLVILYQFRLR
jgi:hypothetical protein